MTDQEQLLLELTNRARSNPSAELSLYAEVSSLNDGLAPNTIAIHPKAPLAPSQALTDAAGNHAQDMLDHDFFAHVGLSGASATDRALAADYVGTVLENIATGESQGVIDESALVHDRHKELFLDPVSRETMLLPLLGVVGVGVRYGSYATPTDTSSLANTNTIRVTEDFGVNSGDAYITGVAFDDAVIADQFYSIGEGLSDFEVRATNQSSGEQFSTTTGPSGGYALQVPNGTYDVVVADFDSNRGFVYTDIEVSGFNVKLDFDASEPPQIQVVLDRQPVAAKKASANVAPLVTSDVATIAEDTAVVVVSGNVLNNDVDPNGDKLKVVRVNGYTDTVGKSVQGSYGSLYLKANGAYDYRLNNGHPAVDALNNGQTLTDTFAYTASDSTAVVSTTLTITIQGVTDNTVTTPETAALVGLTDGTIWRGLNRRWIH